MVFPEYNELYGWLPNEAVNQLSERTRNKIFLSYIFRQPTDAGKVIMRSVVTALGEKFIEYLFNVALECHDNMQVSKEELIVHVEDILEGFATDPNQMLAYVEDFLEKNPDSKPGEKKVDESVQPRDPKTGRFMKK